MARLTKSDWFVLAEQVLVERGAQAVTIEELTKRAGVTKGSFYHHFGNQAGFVDAFLGHLSRRDFGDVVAEVDPAMPPREQLRQLARSVAGRDLVLEAAVRAWATTSPTVAAALRELDRMRTEYTRELYQRVTGDPRLALRLARLHLALHLGSLQVDPPIQGEEYLDLVGTLAALLPPAGPQRKPN